VAARPLKRRSQRLAQATALAVGCALALGACGDDDAEPTTATTTTGGSGGTTASGAPSELRSQLNDLVTETLTSAEGLSPAVARCALEVLEGSVTDAELRAALEEQAETGEVPAELIDAAFEAGVECAGE
jgi:hypothetical protein